MAGWSVVVRCGLGSLVAAVVLVLALGLAGLAYQPDLAIPPGFGGKHVEVLGVPLRVLSEGSGRDLLMLHGCPGSLEDFVPQAEALSKSFRVTRFDRPGHGFSGDGGEHSLAYNARIALGLIEALDLERVVVVGHSFGGSTALALGLLHSPRVAALVVIDSALYRPVRQVPLLYRFAALPVLGVGLARALPRTTVERMAARALRAEFLAGPPPDGFVALRAPLWAEPKIIHALARENTQHAAELARQSPRYGEIDVPIYLIAQRDDAARRANAERLVKARPATVLELVSETGHYVQFERAEAVTGLIRRAAAGDGRLGEREVP